MKMNQDIHNKFKLFLSFPEYAIKLQIMSLKYFTLEPTQVVFTKLSNSCKMDSQSQSFSIFLKLHKTKPYRWWKSVRRENRFTCRLIIASSKLTWKCAVIATTVASDVLRILIVVGIPRQTHASHLNLDCYRWDKKIIFCFIVNISTSQFLTSHQDVANETNDICDTSVSKNKIVVTYGQSIHLGCFETVPEILRDQQVSWYHHSKDNGR